MLGDRWICYSATSPVLNTFSRGAGIGATAQGTSPWWESAACSITLKYPHHEELGTAQQLQILGPCSSGLELPVQLSSSITGYSNSRSRLAEDRGQQVSCKLEKVLPVAHDMMQHFFLPVWGTETKERATFLVLFLAILERKKSNHGPWLVIFS